MNKHAALVNMVKQQLRTGDVLDEAILDLYRDIPRELFVPKKYQSFAYSDIQIPLAHDQRMLTPLEEGKILQALDLQGTETVLEIGTGTGYFTALLSKLAKRVVSVEYFDNLMAQAENNLSQISCNNITLCCGDGYNGWLDEAPYDVIVINGGIESLTEMHRLQVLPGGKLFAIVGVPPVMQGQLHRLDHQENWSMTLLFETNTPLLINKLRRERFQF